VEQAIKAVLKRPQPLETNPQRIERLHGINPCICLFCKKSKMVIVKVLPGISSPDMIVKTQTHASA